MALNIKTQQVGLDESIQNAVNRINRRGLNVKIRASDFTQPLGRITQKADEFTKSLEASNARVIAFGASAAIIGGVSLAFKELVVQSIKVEKILTDINVVLNTSLTNLNKFGKDLFGVARNTSQSLEVAAEAALEFSRQGLSMEETLKRTNDALILTRLTGIKAADAVSGLTAAVNGFADAGLTTTNIINKLAAVDVKFAVSADDLIDALARAGAVAQDAGVNFDQLVGAVTSAQQITARGGAVIGNSFKTIFTRLQRSSTLDRLEELGVAVRDIRGNTLPALSVLQSLAKTYDNLGSSTKAAVAEQVGGVFQINILKAALKDLNRENSLYAQATDISAKATDQAQQKNAQLQKTISSLATQTSLTIQELSANIGELALSPGISKILDAVNSFAGTINDVLGKDSEGLGSDFAKGIVKGIGNVITGPGLVLAFGVFAKLFSNALKFAKSSLKDVLGIVTAKDKERAIQESIVVAMSQNKQLALELNKFAGDKTKQEQIMLGVIKQQTQFLERQQKLAASLAPGLVRKGVTSSLTLPPRKTAAGGHVPSETEKQQEKSSARQSGYTPGNVKSTEIKGIGSVIYNDAETVKKFPGMQQEAIMPPSDSRAGKKYKSNFEKQHGFDPYAFHGFIPNFIDPRTRSQKIKDVLSDPANKNIRFNKPTKKIIKSKNIWDQEILRMYQTNPRQDYLGKPLIEYLTQKGYDKKQLQALARRPSDFQIMSDGFIPNFALQARQQGNVLYLPKAKMVAQTSDSKFNASGYKKIQSPIQSLMREAPSYASVFSELKKLGIDEIARTIYFTNQDSARKAGRSAYRAASKQKTPQKRAEVGGKIYEEKLSNILKPKGYKSTSKHPTANVDFIAPGRMPIEAKYSSAQKDSLMAKSLKIFGDKSLENFLKQNKAPDLASQLSEKKLESALSVANKVWKKGSTLEDVQLLRLNQGFVPNFVNENVLQKQKLIIKDGDSVEGRVAIAPPSIDHRLSGVDAVEKSQPLGKRATQLAIDSYKGKAGIERLQRTRVPGGQAAYGRGLFNDEDLARNLVRQGLGIPDLRYVGRAQYAAELQEAKSNQRGIWHWKHAATKSRRAHPKREFYNHQTGTVEKLSSLTTGKKGKLRFSDEDIAIIESEGLSGLKGRGRGVKIKEGMNRLNYKDKNAFDGFIPNFVFKSIMGKMKAVPGKIKNVLRSGESKFLQSWGSIQDPVKYLKDLGMDQSTALRVSKMSPKDIYAKIKKESEALEMARVDRSVSQYIESIGSRTRSPFYSDNPEVTRIAEQVSSRYHNGFIPNFVNPLAQAIKREEEAGVPRSQIKIERDEGLVSRSNPMGLAVTNTRDEPLGVQQGIKRARAMGIDPKTHGSSGGLIPNFAKPGKGDKDDTASQTNDLTGRLFALTSAAYLLEGAFADMEGTAGSATKTIAGVVKGVSQGALAFEALKPVSVGLSDKLTEWGSNLQRTGGSFGKTKGEVGSFAKKLGKYSKALPVLGTAVAAATPIFSTLKENTTLLDSGLDTLSKSTQRSIKALDAIATTSSIVSDIESVRSDILAESNAANKGTIQSQIKLLNLKSKEAALQQKLNANLLTLATSVSLTADEIAAIRAGDQETLAQKQLEATESVGMESLLKNYTEGAQDISSTKLKNSDSFWGSAFPQLIDGLVGLSNAMPKDFGLSNMAGTEFDSSLLSNTGLEKMNQSILQLSSELVNGSGAQKNIKQGNLDLSRASDIAGKYGDTSGEGGLEALENFQKEIATTNKPLSILIEKLVAMGYSGNQISHLLEKIRMQYGIAFNDTQKTTENTKVRLAQTNKLNAIQARILSDMEIDAKIRSNNLGLEKQIQSNKLRELKHSSTVLDSLGFLSENTSIDAQIEQEKFKIKNDYNNQLKAANNKALAAQDSLIKESLMSEDSNSFSQLQVSSLDENKKKKSQKDQDAEFESKRKEIEMNLLVYGREELAAKIISVENSREASLAAAEYLASIKDSAKKSEEIKFLHDQGYITNKELNSQLEKIAQEKGVLASQAAAEKGLAEEGLKTLRKELEFNKNGLAAARQRVAEFQKIKNVAGEVYKGMKESLDAEVENSKITSAVNAEKRKVLASGALQAQRVLAQTSLLDQQITQEMESLANQAARIKAEEENTKLQEMLNENIRQKIINQSGEFQGKIRAREQETSAKSEINPTTGQNFYQGQADFNMTDLESATTELANQFIANKQAGAYQHEAQELLVQAQINSREATERFTENLNAGTFEWQAFDEMKKASEDFTKEMIMAKAKLNDGEGFRLGEREVERRSVSSQMERDSAIGMRDAYSAKGATVKAAEADLNVAKQQKEMNLELGNEALFRDTITERIKENNLALEKFGETLANTTFDAVEGGFQDLFKNITDGTHSMGDALKNFAGGIAQSIGDALSARASKQITSGIFEMMGMGDTPSQPASTTALAAGGSVGNSNKVPAMLTAGEYVVRKKIVDRLGINSFDKMNESGSLEDLYNQPNEDMFDLSSEGSAPMPALTQMSNGGILDQHLFTRDNNVESGAPAYTDQGLMDADSFNYLNQTIERFNGGLVNLLNHFDKGSPGGVEDKKGWWDTVKSSLSSSADDSPINKISKGAGTMFGQFMASKSQNQDSEYTGPIAPEKSKKLNVSSALDIDPYGDQMTARFKANDQYRKDYGQYLLDKYQHDVNQRNAKVSQRANQWGSLVSGLTGMIAAKGLTSEMDFMKEGMKSGLSRTEYVKSLADTSNANDTEITSNQDTKIGNYLVPKMASLGKNETSVDLSGSASIGGGSSTTYNNRKKQNNYFNGGSVLHQNSSPYSYFNQGGTVNSRSIYSPYSYFNNGGSVYSKSSNPYSYFNQGGTVNSRSIYSPYSYFNNGGSVYSKSSNPYSYFNQGGSTNLNTNAFHTYLNQGGFISSSTFTTKPHSYFNYGGTVSNQQSTSNKHLIQHMSAGGKVRGPGGIDKVGPIMLDKGEYVIKASSVQNIEKKHPGFFDKLNSAKMNQGGVVQSTSSPLPNVAGDTNSTSSNNVTVNINITSDGSSSTSGSGGTDEKAFAGKIKDAVVGIIAQEKRVGGMLSGK